MYYVQKLRGFSYVVAEHVTNFQMRALEIFAWEPLI
jgi:hypothetical protein